jgi:hypothetical protein
MDGSKIFCKKAGKKLFETTQRLEEEEDSFSKKLLFCGRSCMYN